MRRAGIVLGSLDYGLISQTGTWYVQVAFDDVKLAVRSQYWMLGVMVGFTSLALWLLAQATA